MIGAAVQWLPTSAHIGPRLAAGLDVPGHQIGLHRFPDGELRVTTGPAARTTIVCCSLDDPNEKLIALLFAAETLRREGARRLVLVAPYLAYMRQDAAFHPGEAISQRVIGDLLARPFDRVITVDAHLHRTPTLEQAFAGIEADNLSAEPDVEAMLRAHALASDTIVVGPDAESRPWVAELARRLGLTHTVGQKTRGGDRSVQIAFPDPALFDHHPVLVVDDIVSSGGTLIACAKALQACGVTSIDAVVIHALFAPELADEFRRSGVRSVRSSNSVLHPTNAIRLENTLIRALQREVFGMATIESSP